MISLPRFSVENRVLVNMLMVTIIIGGAYGGLTLVREMFPESRPNQVAISTIYPGATPSEVEKGIAIRIEEAIKDVEDIDKIETHIGEGSCTILVTMKSGAKDIDLAVNDFKAAIDTIPRDELPEDAEETRVMKFEPQLPVISVSIYGDADEAALKDVGREMRDELLLLLPESKIELSGARKAELLVEVQPEKLTEYRLSLAEIAETIRHSNLDLPAGQVKTPQQNVAVRTLMETDDADRIAETILRTTVGGQLVRISDVGRVIDGFEDSDIRGRFNGHPSVSITVYKTGNGDAVEIATRVKAYVAGRVRQPMDWDWQTRLKSRLGMDVPAMRIYQQQKNEPLPAALRVMVHTDLSRFIADRLDLVKRNGLWGLVLVFCSLLFFLNWRVAFWVMMGVVLSIAGAIMVMHMIGETLNLISMFGLIIALGMLVDDAIVVGENVFARVEEGEEPHLAAIKGAEEVAWPVVIAVMTTIGAFMPLMFIEGQIGDFMGVLPVVVTCALGISLLEALSILPCHLAEWLMPVRQDLGHAPPRHWLARIARPLRAAQQNAVRRFTEHHYKWLLERAVRYRYVTMALAVAGLLIALGLVAGGRVPFVFVQKMDSETIVVSVRMPVGTPIEETQRTMEAIEALATDKNRFPEIKTIYTLLGESLRIGEHGTSSTNGTHLAQSIIELTTVDERERPSEAIIAEMRAETDHLPGVTWIKYESMQGGPGGAEIEMEITGKILPDLLAAAEVIKKTLAGFSGVYDIADDFEAGRREAQIQLRDSARPLGITARSLALEVRGAFYGLEARTLQRDREDVDIMVRFPEERRRHIYELEAMHIATPDGRMIPFREVARIEEAPGYSSLRRVDQRRAVVVSADVDHSKGNPEVITSALSTTIRQLEADYPGLRIEFGGNKRELAKSFGSLKRDFLIALVIIFVLLAGLFKSYVQPMIVMTAIPFGLIGAVAGHYLMGYPLTILSIIGIVALAGIAVNDSLILVDFTNKETKEGCSALEAVIQAGQRRLRPIILTSLTTILGLAPMMAETSWQARFLIPMAISISFGLLFTTILTLLVVPAIYLIVDDFFRMARWVWYGPMSRVTPAA